LGCSAAHLIRQDPPASQSAKDKKKPVDTQTRHALKQDKFAQAAASSADWISGHRAGVLRWVIIVGVAVVVVVGASIFWNMRTGAAEDALGRAIDLYDTPLAEPGAPPEAGTYSTAAARSKEANREFVAIAHDFSWFPEATKARYFAGITYMDLGQNGNAETELNAATGSWDHNLSNLAKLALAGLYHQTNRDNDAVSLYNELAAKPSTTVSAGVAQLALADLYVSEGKTDMARSLWAKVKDADKDGAAGQIAEQKLAAK
jgi:predicted negative regulator of RcsB-dependent stress response